MNKKLRVLIAAVILVFAVSGCGPEAKTASQVLTETAQSSNNMKSLEAQGSMKMNVSAGGQDIDMNMGMDMAVFTDPYKIKMNMTIDLGGLGSQSSDVYLIQDGGKYYSYTNIAGQWYKMEMDQALFQKTIDSYDNSAYIDALTSSSESFEMEETEEDGKKVYKLEGVITGDALNKMVEATGVMNQLADAGIDTSIYDNTGDMKVTVYVDKETSNLYKISIDMKELMKNALETALSGTGEEIAVNDCVMEMIYKNYNSASDFELPKEAENAQ